MVTACQRCRQNLTRWQDEDPLDVAELVDLVYEAAGLEPQEIEADSGMRS